MSIQVGTYRPKGNENLLAVQVTHENAEEVAIWCGGRAVMNDDPADTYVLIPTIGQGQQAMVGEYVTQEIDSKEYIARSEAYMAKNYEEYGHRLPHNARKVDPRFGEGLAVRGSEPKATFDEVVLPEDAPDDIPESRPEMTHRRGIHPSLFGKPRL